MIKAATLSYVILMSTFCFCQETRYVGNYNLKNQIESELLIDSLTGTKFFLDENHIFITAVNSVSDTLWRTDPYTDMNLEPYRVKRPIIVKYSFLNNERTDFKEVIGIAYNNTVFGTINNETGEFIFYGQD